MNIIVIGEISQKQVKIVILFLNFKLHDHAHVFSDIEALLTLEQALIYLNSLNSSIDFAALSAKQLSHIIDEIIRIYSSWSDKVDAHISFLGKSHSQYVLVRLVEQRNIGFRTDSNCLDAKHPTSTTSSEGLNVLHRGPQRLCHVLVY